MKYKQVNVSRAVFRAYDIRGIIPNELDEHAFYSIGLGLAQLLQKLDRSRVFLARDGRLTSDSLADALKQGLLQSGVDVIDLGIVATPLMYYATATQELDCGLMVTGSHNPKDYNGIKMVLAGKTLVQDDIEELYNIVHSGKRLHGQGQELALDIVPAYKNTIISDITIKRPIKVVVDCGNGVAGPLVPVVLKALGCEVIPLYCDIDGRFPNHHPDPTVEENLTDLKKAVLEHQADIGLAFDGDADRLGLVTETGQMIWPDRLLMFYAKELLTRCKGATIVYDVKCSNHLEQVITQAGGVAKMCPTGHSIVKGVMKKDNAALAGEMSGHIFFKDRWYGFDDALYSACRLLEIVSANERLVSEQFHDIPDSVNTPEIKIAIDEAQKFQFMDAFCQQASFPDGKIITIDGIRVEFSSGWGLLRASNTTPCLVARFEADDKESLLHIQALFKKQILSIHQGLSLPF